MVQLANKFTSKFKCSHEPCRIFKSAHKLLACARLFHECKILASIVLCSCVVHTYFSAREQCKRVLQMLCVLACMNSRLHCYNPPFWLPVKPSIHPNELCSKASGDLRRSAFHVAKHVQQLKCDYSKQCTLFKIT